MTPTPAPALLELTYLNLDQLGPHPDNVRKTLGDLTELTKSIDGTGILEPLLVLPPGDDGVHLVVAGHRRLAAALKATVTTVPCVIRDLAPAEVVEAMLVENLQRAEITPVEEALAYARLVELGTTATHIAKKVGRTVAHVKGRIALTALPPELLRLLEDGVLTLAKAAEIAAHADDPDAMGWVTKEYLALSRHDREWFNPGSRLARYIGDRDQKAALAAEAAKLDKAGLTRFEPPRGWWQRAYLDLGVPCKVELLEFDTAGRKAHAKEPCHQVLLEIKDPNAPELKVTRTPMCVEPPRHTTAADEADRSDLQIPTHDLTGDDDDDVVPGTHASGPDGAAERAAEFAASEQRRKAREEAEEARAAFTRTFATSTPTGMPEFFAVAILEDVAQYSDPYDMAPIAGCPPDDNDLVATIWESVLAGGTAEERDPWLWAWSFVGAEASRNYRIGGGQGTRGPAAFIAYLRFLATVGYELSDYETGVIAEYEAAQVTAVVEAAVPDVDAMELSDEAITELLTLHELGLANRDDDDRLFSIVEQDPALIEDLRMRGLLETTDAGNHDEGQLTETGCVVATILAGMAPET